MPKKPKIRPNYKADSQYLLRLAHAIEYDSSRSTEWKIRAMEIVRQLANLLLEPNGQIQETQEATQEKTASDQAGVRGKAT